MSDKEIDLTHRGMAWQEADQLIRECIAQAGLSWGNPKPMTVNILHRVANAAHRAGFSLVLKRLSCAPELDDFTEAERFRCERSKELRAQMEAAGDFETEEFGFAQQLVDQYGGEHIDDNAEVYKIHVKDLYVIMKMLGYSRAPVAAESLSYDDLVKVEDGKVSKVMPASAPQSLLVRLAGIAAGCSDPDTTDALDALIATTQQAMPEPDDDDKWCDVALRFDKHRMQALWHLKAMLQDPARHADIVRQFLKDPTHPAAATPEPVGWQPIQTAPTDGTKFLGWRWGRVATAYRVQRDDCEMWCFGGQSGAFEHWPETRPEFWMPHPPEPALAAQAKGDTP